MGLEYEFSLQNLADSANALEDVPRAFDHAIDKIKDTLEPNSVVGGSICHPNLKQPLLLSFDPYKNLTDLRL